MNKTEERSVTVKDIKRRLEMFDSEQVVAVGHEDGKDLVEIIDIVEDDYGVVIIEMPKSYG